MINKIKDKILKMTYVFIRYLKLKNKIYVYRI